MVGTPETDEARVDGALICSARHEAATPDNTDSMDAVAGCGVRSRGARTSAAKKGRLVLARFFLSTWRGTSGSAPSSVSNFIAYVRKVSYDYVTV